ncbi:pyridoxine 5'-phosphate synthase [Leptospira kobayashii]|uniref:Pyridoxine 5'-phosphate synthase n=1 Tax=Leptospira kobayashii TaxID=1917830 RepID=A0ABM7UTF3_9LEPT|nr:pyridoxine 5'-phosphate synthase [Leptospira kobayashii]BDA80149.1 pyridoxine 5'-phosphate synthase [Leptospira kobayashii]
MAQLSVNVNKIATLRNSRGGDIPNVVHFSELILNAGAHGITVHPRKDQRHITTEDVFSLQIFLSKYNRNASFHREFNIEGEPSERFVKLVLEAKPDQATLVPVRPGEITSDHGFNLKDKSEVDRLAPIIDKFHREKIRVSLFMDTDSSQYKTAKEIGADRIEFYTGPFAHAYDQSEEAGKVYYKEYENAAEVAFKLGLGINAGHDLDTNNLKLFSHLPHLAEVSIGHRLVAQSLVDGMEKTVKSYLKILSKETGS